MDFKLLLLCLLVAAPAASAFMMEIGGDVLSTLRIVKALCYKPGDHNDKLAAKFFECYDYAPGKPLFVKCQKRINGNILNTKRRVDVACQNPQLIPPYAMCLQREFRKAGMSMTIAVTKVNVCQARVVGIS